MFGSHFSIQYQLHNHHFIFLLHILLCSILPSFPYHFIIIQILLQQQTSMAETNNTHIVEIPVDEEHHQHHLCSSTSMFEAIEDHPLTEISESPGHLLLLKLWQREEKLFAQHIAKKETRLYSIKSELFQLCSFFFIFHGFFLTLLFTSWANANSHNKTVCKKWWVPSMVSLCTSLVFVVLSHMKVVRFSISCFQVYSLWLVI
ncbi:hypothetical protein Lalb_Chr15g0082511 [Lupinus albus]|uniref:Transmembrane protein n=1 Tax=Lupinus albus TaxID=3870 RepID=A0A6A4P928_LUPAL|nr:hypothetical protein Lalb_Chr15g0082511 [Lupinus albus]